MTCFTDAGISNFGLVHDFAHVALDAVPAQAEDPAHPVDHRVRRDLDVFEEQDMEVVRIHESGPALEDRQYSPRFSCANHCSQVANRCS